MNRRNAFEIKNILLRGIFSVYLRYQLPAFLQVLRRTRELEVIHMHGQQEVILGVREARVPPRMISKPARSKALLQWSSQKVPASGCP